MNENSIRPLTKEDKEKNSRYHVGALFNISKKEADDYFLTAERPIYPVSWVLNQGQFELNNDECSFISFSRAASFLNGVHVGPHFFGMMTRMRAGAKLEDYGASLRDGADTARKVGALLMSDEPYGFKDGRAVIYDPTKYADIPVLAQKAAENLAGSVIWIAPHDGMDAFDVLRATIAKLNKFYGKTHCAVFGMVWDYPMTDVYINTPVETGSGHAIPLYWPENAYFRAIQSYGLEAGNNGEQMIHRTIINKWTEVFGCYVPIDATRAEIDAVLAKGGKLDDMWLVGIIRFIVSLFKNKKLTLPQLQTEEEKLSAPPSRPPPDIAR